MSCYELNSYVMMMIINSYVIIMIIISYVMMMMIIIRSDIAIIGAAHSKSLVRRTLLSIFSQFPAKSSRAAVG